MDQKRFNLRIGTLFKSVTPQIRAMPQSRNNIEVTFLSVCLQFYFRNSKTCTMSYPKYTDKYYCVDLCERKCTNSSFVNNSQLRVLNLWTRLWSDRKTYLFKMARVVKYIQVIWSEYKNRKIKMKSNTICTNKTSWLKRYITSVTYDCSWQDFRRCQAAKIAIFELYSILKELKRFRTFEWYFQKQLTIEVIWAKIRYFAIVISFSVLELAPKTSILIRSY